MQWLKFVIKLLREILRLIVDLTMYTYIWSDHLFCWFWGKYTN